jgi:hypothetical protein
MCLQTVKFIAKQSKCAGLAQEISFSAPKIGGTCCGCLMAQHTSKKECNKLDLTAAQYI